jgi:hypothetical protein
MFRDDHEAALERIAALESELEREHAERDALVIELDATRRALERAQQETMALATQRSTPLVTAQEPYLGLARRRQKSLVVMIVGMCAVVAALGLFGYVVHPPLAIFLLLLVMVPVAVFARSSAPAMRCPTCKLPIKSTSQKHAICPRCDASLGD